MQASDLIGVWKLESNAGIAPVEDGINTALVQFKADGSFVDATELRSLLPGKIPEKVHRVKGMWKLDDNVLEQSFAAGAFGEGSEAGAIKTLIAIDNDRLEIAAGQHDRKSDRKYIGIFEYSRVNM